MGVLLTEKWRRITWWSPIRRKNEELLSGTHSKGWIKKNCSVTSPEGVVPFGLPRGIPFGLPKGTPLSFSKGHWEEAPQNKYSSLFLWSEPQKRNPSLCLFRGGHRKQLSYISLLEGLLRLLRAFYGLFFCCKVLYGAILGPDMGLFWALKGVILGPIKGCFGPENGLFWAL